jgi:hypothetical protein
VTTRNIRPNPYANQRRSQRIVLSVAIQITGIRANGSPFSERTSTLVVNAHGALIQLRESVLVGQQLRIKNLSTNEEMDCEVMDINDGDSPGREVGVAFSEPCPRFWRVSFPPADWTPRSPEAKHYTSESLPAKPALVKR